MSYLHRLVFVLFLCTGCTSAGAGGVAAPPARPLAEFPSRAELGAIAPATPPAAVFEEDAKRTEGWQVDEASLRLAGPDGDPTLARHVEAFGGTALTPSPALACAARELGRFGLANKAPPTEGLRRHLVARCGSTLPSVAYAYQQGEVSPNTADEAIWREALPRLQAQFKDSMPAGSQAGVALVREGRRVVLAGFVGKPEAVLEPTVGPGPGAEGAVLVKGTLRSPTELVLGFATLGKYGVGQCAPVPVPLPRFELRCPTLPGDESTWISVETRAPKQLLLRTTAQVLYVRPGARVPYAPAMASGSATVSDAAGFSAAVLGPLNDLRRRGKMRPLELAPAQSEVNARAVGPFLTAEQTGNASLADRIALGLMAGWDVPGVIRRGDFSVFLSSSTTDAATWLAEALELPTGRWMLLEPDRRFVAFGPHIAPDNRGIGAVVTTYALFDTADHHADADRVFAGLTSQRITRGLAQPTRVTKFEALSKEVRNFEQGKPLQEVLDDVLARAVSALGRDVHGAVFESTDLDVIPFPPELFSRLPPYVAIEVTHRKAPGGAWGQYVIFIITMPRSEGEGDPRAAAPVRRATF